MAKHEWRGEHGKGDDPQIGLVARPNDIVMELDKLVRRSQKYESTRDATWYNFRNACFHCGKLMAYFWSQYQVVRRKEEEPK